MIPNSWKFSFILSSVIFGRKFINELRVKIFIRNLIDNYYDHLDFKIFKYHATVLIKSKIDLRNNNRE